MIYIYSLIYSFNTLFIKLIFIDLPVDKDTLSISFVNFNTFSYDLSIFFIINSRVFVFISTCLSEKCLLIITLSKSSVGKSMPINRKLLNLDLRSNNLISLDLIGEFEFKTKKLFD